MLRVWDGMSGKMVSEKLLRTQVKDSRMYTVCADPQGKNLATCTLNESIGIYDAVTNELIREWMQGPALCLARCGTSPDGYGWPVEMRRERS